MMCLISILPKLIPIEHAYKILNSRCFVEIKYEIFPNSISVNVNKSIVTKCRSETLLSIVFVRKINTEHLFKYSRS